MHQNQNLLQTLSPQMIQSMKILQMNLQELHDYVGELLQENPVLEFSDQAAHTEYESAPEDDFYKRMDWLAANDHQNMQYDCQDAEEGKRDFLANIGCVLNDENDLRHYLLSQFEGLRLDPVLTAAIHFLVEHLDENGWLDADISLMARQAGMPQMVFERALAELQAADPAGVGARSLEECLKLQIGRIAGDHHLAEIIAENHLAELAKGHLAQISRRTGASRQAVQDACALIRTLHPYPCMGFSAPENPHYITPDIYLIDQGGRFEAASNHAVLPQLRMNAYYLRLMRETADRETREYLLQKSSQAKWVVHSIAQRQATILSCAQYIADKQEAFLRNSAKALKSMTMQELARKLNIHESTVSRAIRDKYLQGPNGMYPLSFFFSRALGQEETSSDAAKKLLKTLIENEETPLSDQKLCDEMRRRGCEVARRTVAKYREELGYPSAMSRRSAV